jgi:hypothetical protein
MNTEETRRNRCRNDGCVRPCEPGEPYCPSCCLEMTLFHREERAVSAGSAERDALRRPGERTR